MLLRNLCLFARCPYLVTLLRKGRDFFAMISCVLVKQTSPDLKLKGTSCQPVPHNCDGQRKLKAFPAKAGVGFE